MRIASYNIRKAVGLDWKRSGERIVRVLEEIDADVVLLQESDKRIGARAGVLPVQDLLQRLGYRLVDLSTRPQSHGWHGNAILYRDHALNLKRSTRIELPSLEPRGAVSALFATPNLEVIGVHLGLARRSRTGQLTALRRHIEGSDHPVLIAGDFNAWRRDPAIAAALGGSMILPGNSFHASLPTAPLDRFVLKGDVRQVAAHVHGSALAARASDHLPIVIDLELPAPTKLPASPE